ncbi:MAG TPA: hypothetical protein VE987_10720 [Polyangiaceae bacterium]|nr:hypothetical protein [Polyangiaceae bacterium]
MRSASDRLLVAVSAAAAVLLPGGARAQRGSLDSTYGRLEGDVAVVVGAGAAVVDGGARAEGEVRLRYLETAGLFATYEDAAAFASSADPIRVVGLGFELRPLFLFRWLQGHEAQRPRLDLALDSIALELGATFGQLASGADGVRRGLEVGLGLELPLLQRASGPWIGVRGAVRWSDDALGSGALTKPDDRQAVLTVTLAWHQLFAAHIIDVGDEAPR